MGLLKKFFGGGPADTQPASSQFRESEPTVQQAGSANAPRRELIQVVLRDTMRKYGVPSDWMDVRILSVVTRKGLSGMHVHFVVAPRAQRLVEFVHAFQESFWEEIEKFEPRARDWLFSVAWQFDGRAPRPSKPENEATPAETNAQSSAGVPDEVASDLQALYAIRDQVLNQTALEPDGPAEPSGKRGGPGAPD